MLKKILKNLIAESKNLIPSDMLAELTAALDEIENNTGDPQVRLQSVINTGEHPKDDRLSLLLAVNQAIRERKKDPKLAVYEAQSLEDSEKKIQQLFNSLRKNSKSPKE